jgi:hypothetical protein
MVSARSFALRAHALLDHCPLAVLSHKKRVMIQLVACLDGGVVHFRRHFAGVREVFGLVFGEAKFA